MPAKNLADLFFDTAKYFEGQDITKHGLAEFHTFILATKVFIDINFKNFPQVSDKNIHLRDL